MTIRTIQWCIEKLLSVFVFLLFVLYAALSVRAFFFPGHCAVLIGFSVCLKG